jgi:hypothetical protein
MKSKKPTKGRSSLVQKNLSREPNDSDIPQQVASGASNVMGREGLKHTAS